MENQDILKQIKGQLNQAIDQRKLGQFVPTGLQDKMILSMAGKKFDVVENKVVVTGDEDYAHPDVIEVRTANDVGKTALITIIMREMIFKSDDPFFQYPLFQKWPHLKSIRYSTESEAAKEDNAFFTEIKKWWPAGRYSFEKGGKHYPRRITTDNGWEIEILTYKQDKKDFESANRGMWIMDEPGKDWMIGAMNSRLKGGGLGLVFATPVRGNPVIDAIDDLESKGARVKRIFGKIWENDRETGLWNHLGTKRGHRTAQEIEDYIRKIPESERRERLHGENVVRSGRVYSTFSENIHVRDYDIDSALIKTGNLHHIQDPHPKYYPFMLWIVRTANDKHIVINEWPTFDELGAYYDEVRKERICQYTIEQRAKIIKIMSMLEYGFRLHKCGMDPRMAKATEDEWGKTEGLVAEYSKYGIDYQLPPFEQIAPGRDDIMTALKYDDQMSIGLHNDASLLVLKHCKNTIRMMNRHYWDEDKESERYKEGPDCLRYYFAMIRDTQFVDYRIKDKRKKDTKIINPAEEVGEAMRDVGL